LAKLTKAQWKKLKSRLDSGEKAASLAREYGITRQTISDRFGKTDNKAAIIVANQIVEAENSIRESLQKLTPALQIEACNIASELMAVSNHMAGGARYNAMSFHRLARIANTQVQKLNDDEPCPEALLTIGTLTRVGNETAKVPVDLLKVNQAAVDSERNKAIPDESKIIEIPTEDWTTEQLITISRSIPHDFDRSPS
jgi:hypothetical protein